MLSIHTNYSSANATKHVKHAHLNINSSIEKLSTGKRINAGKDDPAGLAISMRLSAQVQGLKQATQNVESAEKLLVAGTSVVETAQTILIRIKQLATRGSTDTLTEADKKHVSEEIGQMQSQLNALQYTKIAGHQPWVGDIHIAQTGANSGDNISFTGLTWSTYSPFTTDYKSLFDAEDANLLDTLEANIVAVSRGIIGFDAAFANRLEKIAKINDILTIQLGQSVGNITDTDFALETTKLAKHQIAEQAGIAIAAQANASVSIVLQLIN